MNMLNGLKNAEVLGAFYGTSKVGAQDNLKRDYGFTSLTSVLSAVNEGINEAQAVNAISKVPGETRVICKEARKFTDDGENFVEFTVSVVTNEGTHRLAPSIRKSGDITFMVKHDVEVAQA